MNDQPEHDRKPWKKFGAERADTDDLPVVVWQLAGLFTDCKESYSFLDAFREEIRSGNRPVILDLSEIDHVTSCGAGILGACYCSATNAGRTLCLAGVAERAEAVLTVIGLAKVIKMYPSRETAILELST
jgi:anti-anti-sigma factor